ncbi:adenylate kinase [Limnoglobus roseus]|uniref:Adenylate kinase n=1 Tax=Limnoglobus roseus TaxID=2598579 RepID=A0A5C1AB06_9BACT|nr:adenylate kinase [Limnoglobus roseus]QEL15206.1 adenylate kinase [Limnoglobus roseus]
MRLVLVGAPGSGKGTQAELLVKRLGLTYIGTGDILRAAIKAHTPVGLQAEPIIKQGRLVPDAVVNDLVAELFQRPDRPEAFVLDGYPRTYAQAIAFDALLNLQYLRLDGVVYLTVKDEEVVRRISSRRCCENVTNCGVCFNLLARRPKVDGVCDNCGGNLVTRADDKEETVRRRLVEFHANTDQLIEYYRGRGLLREVSALDPMETIYANVVKALKGP